jgi:serine beta-lactamase-like protein LACTB
MTLPSLMLLVALIFPSQAAPEPPPAPPSAATAPPDAEALREEVTAHLTAFMKETGIPGLSAAVVTGGKPAFSIHLGLADVEQNAPVRPDTVFRIGGISMPITAVAVLQLVQDGRLSLDASLRDYVPEYPDKGKTITIRHTLAHLSGVRPEKSSEEWTSCKPYPSLLSSLDAFKSDPLVREPGGVFLVSNFGYTLLGLVIERVSSQPYDDYIRSHIAEPLGMRSLRVEDPQVITPHRARGYNMDDGKLRNADHADLSVRTPGSGLVATADDLAQFAAAVLNGRVLNEELRTLMLTEQKTSDDKPTRYGLGWFVRTDAGRRIVGHSGPETGASSFLLIYPDDAAAVVILTNLQSTNVTKPGLEIGRMVLGIAPAPAAPSGANAERPD